MNTRRILVLAVDASVTEPGTSEHSEVGIAFAERLKERHGLHPNLSKGEGEGQNQSQSQSQSQSYESLRVIGDTQLRIEHTLPLQSCDLAIFVETSSTLQDPLALEELQILAGHHLEASNGDLTPRDLMHTLKTLGTQHRVPLCFTLSIQCDATGTVPASSLEAAMQFMGRLLEDTDPEQWRAFTKPEQRLYGAG